MVLLTGFYKIKTAVFISGKGSNLKSLIQFSKLKKSPISINLIISNNPDSKGLQYAKIFKIKKKIFNFKKNKIDEKKILYELKKNKIGLICLAGFIKYPSISSSKV
jgi:phosphoribosylglycinamide formyltransferase-1